MSGFTILFILRTDFRCFPTWNGHIGSLVLLFCHELKPRNGFNTITTFLLINARATGALVITCERPEPIASDRSLLILCYKKWKATGALREVFLRGIIVLSSCLEYSFIQLFCIADHWKFPRVFGKRVYLPEPLDPPDTIVCYIKLSTPTFSMIIL